MKARQNGRFIKQSSARKFSNLIRFDKKEKTVNDKGEIETLEIEETWKEGRRIVELGVLIKGLRSCCHCSKRLNLLDCVDEKRYGLASILHISCQECKGLNSVPTGKRHATSTDNTGPTKCFDVNSKLAAAMVNAGIGEQQMNNILAELNIPPIHHKTLKEREREVGRAFEEVADDLCNGAIRAEIECTNSGDGIQVPEVSCDGGWQKRGSGKNYNSLSGHVTVIGKHTKKCVAYGVACKNCRKCKYLNKTKNVHKAHPCRRNWAGSAKGMEPFLTVKCLSNLKEKGLNVKKIVMDDDTITFIRARKSLSPGLTKSSDRNHVIKNLTSSLMKISQANKEFTNKGVKHFKKCFNYALHQNKGDPLNLKKNIDAIVPHSFGDHSQCNDKWCGFLRDENTYKHKTLPNGDDLKGPELKQSLQDLFHKFSRNAESLSDLGTSNPNENLNNMISKKAPKSQHYSGSESLAYRVSAAVAQKNTGHKYLIERERLRCKENRFMNDKMDALKEGVTYESNVTVNKSESEIEKEIEEIDIQPLPKNSKQSTSINTLNKEVIVFDLETTGFCTDSSIIQISAKNISTNDNFNRFVVPDGGNIPKEVSKLTGLEFHGYTMYQNLIPVKSVSLQKALQDFTS
ncbi:hypothetical protein FSP39_005637 [Pinctada imbricata]|uniref:Mutator-like transposase domain-containing protein n=1 Tax=Pinctada imbricata TaxID=66713 RepID=A0AA89C6H1_PINIB|nr:hypothetical protein FSP39_005637 [Pinctada imbricata]